MDDIPPLQVSNVVSRFGIAIRNPDGTRSPIYLNLEKIALLRDLFVRSNPKRFAAVITTIDLSNYGFKPKTANIFQTGSVNFPGCDSIESARASAHMLIYRLAKNLKAPLELYEMSTVLIVAKVEMGFNVDTLEMSSSIPNCTLNLHGPNAFPAAQITIWVTKDQKTSNKKKPKMKRIVYIIPWSGKVVITGVNNLEDAEKHRQCAAIICMAFRANENIPQRHHQQIQIKKQKKQWVRRISMKRS